jgi:hypothetical protein
MLDVDANLVRLLEEAVTRAEGDGTRATRYGRCSGYENNLITTDIIWV